MKNGFSEAEAIGLEECTFETYIEILLGASNKGTGKTRTGILRRPPRVKRR